MYTLKSLSYIHEDHAITYIYGRRCNSAERGFRDTTCTCKKPFILLKLKIMLRSFLGVLIMLHFKFRGLILQKMFTVPKICIHFLRIFFCNAQNQNISYNKKKSSSLNVLVYEPTLKCSSLCKKDKRNKLVHDSNLIPHYDISYPRVSCFFSQDQVYCQNKISCIATGNGEN